MVVSEQPRHDLNQKTTPPESEVRVAELVLPGAERMQVEPDVSVIVPVTERPAPLADLYLE
jgi:hypothetical protein